MQLLQQRLANLEHDLLTKPVRISVYHDMPFAIFHYPPRLEYALRKEMNLFKIRLENHGKKIITISLAELFWQAIQDNDTLDNIIANEKKFGFSRQAETIHAYLTLDDFSPLPRLVLGKMKNADPENHIVFLTRASALAPNLYRMSILLNELHQRTMVPCILFYPGTKEGEAQLRYMDMPDREAISRSNYRVKIY